MRKSGGMLPFMTQTVEQLHERIERLEHLVAMAAAGNIVTSEEQRARNVVTVALPAYTYVAGVITGNAAGAIGAQDGVVNVAGDSVFLPAGIATAAAHQGAYVVTAPGGAGVFVLTRVDWMPEGAVLTSGFEVRLGGEGTVFQNTIWQAMTNADTFIVGTTDSQFFPQEVSGLSVLEAGTFTIATVPILAASTFIGFSRQLANTSVLTVGGYHATVAGVDGITPGNLGTAAAVVQAAVAAGTINNADISTLRWTIRNQQR